MCQSYNENPAQSLTWINQMGPIGRNAGAARSFPASKKDRRTEAAGLSQ